MAVYSMFLDQKVTSCMRTEFNVEGNTIEEAKAKAKEMFDNGVLSEIPWEEVPDSKEVMLPIENDGQATAELYYYDDLLQGNDEFYSNKLDS